MRAGAGHLSEGGRAAEKGGLQAGGRAKWWCAVPPREEGEGGNAGVAPRGPTPQQARWQAGRRRAVGTHPHALAGQAPPLPLPPVHSTDAAAKACSRNSPTAAVILSPSTRHMHDLATAPRSAWPFAALRLPLPRRTPNALLAHIWLRSCAPHALAPAPTSLRNSGRGQPSTCPPVLRSHM